SSIPQSLFDGNDIPIELLDESGTTLDQETFPFISNVLEILVLLITVVLLLPETPVRMLAADIFPLVIWEV
ncbi:MAG: hypothetical protein II631_07190, partial [Treponema sp.]|nr:hypothetical protein [Treponema sp.]